MAKKIEYLALVGGDSRQWSVPDMLSNTVQDLEAGEVEADRALVLLLDTKDNRFAVHYANAGLCASEAVALLETAKQLFLRDLGY